MKDMELKKFLIKNWKLVAAILYILLPVDIIPDFIPMLGATDDLLVLVITLVLRYVDYKKDSLVSPSSKSTTSTKSAGETTGTGTSDNREIIEGEIVD